MPHLRLALYSGGIFSTIDQYCCNLAPLSWILKRKKKKEVAKRTVGKWNPKIWYQKSWLGSNYSNINWLFKCTWCFRSVLGHHQMLLIYSQSLSEGPRSCCGGHRTEVRLRSTEIQPTYNICSRGGRRDLITTTPTWLAKEQSTGDFLDGPPSSYQSRPTGLNFEEQLFFSLWSKSYSTRPKTVLSLGLAL